MKVSIIIIKTNEEQFRKALQYINKQSVIDDIEVITIENKNNINYSNAATALNDGANQAHGSVLVFMHQDLYLTKTDLIERYYNYLMANVNHIIGVAGARGDDATISDIFETENHIKRCTPTNGVAIPVASLDECLFAMKKELWDKYKFDELTCNDWHCYCMDICFMNTISGGKNVVVSDEVIHDSIGNPNQIGYLKTIKNLIKKWTLL